MPNRPLTTILIVDDNIGARRSIEGLLASEGYNLMLAESGIEALKIAEDILPDLILLDVMMPGMNGFEVCDTIRKNPVLSEIPIIMITALDDDDSMLKGIDAGADDFLSKPINKLELRSRVKGISRLNRYRKLCSERLKFEWVVQNSEFGYLTLEGGDRIVFANPRAREMLNLPLDEDSPNLPFFDVVNSCYTCRPDDAHKTWLQDSENTESEPIVLVQSLSKDSPTRWIRATNLRLNRSSADTALIRLADITSSMRSFQEKHSFSRMITHKLLTPLHALKAAEQMFESAKREKDGELIERVFDLQHKGIDRLEYDIESIVRFLESSSSSESNSTTKLKDLAKSLKQLGEEAGLPFSLITDFSDKDDWLVNIAEYNFETCVREIIENAIKFHHQGTPVLDTSIQVSESNKNAVFKFENDGTLLSDEEIQNAWKPYWQADRYYTGEVKGMGMGLAFIATNIWSAGGTCSIQNNATGNGICVTLTVPIFLS